MKSTIVLILLFGTTCAFKFNPFGIFGHDSSEENNKPHPSGPTGEEFPFPTFLINGNLSADSLNSWFEILRNESASRADVQNAQDIWALQQSSDVQKSYADWKQKVADFIKELISIGDSAVSNSSQSVKDLYEKIKAIRLNDALTRTQECQQIRQAFDEADKKDVKKLLKTIPGVQGNCFGEPRIGHKHDSESHEGSGSNSDESNEDSTDESTTTTTQSPTTTTQSTNFFKRLFGF